MWILYIGWAQCHNFLFIILNFEGNKVGEKDLEGQFSCSGWYRSNSLLANQRYHFDIHDCIGILEGGEKNYIILNLLRQCCLKGTPFERISKSNRQVRNSRHYRSMRCTSIRCMWRWRRNAKMQLLKVWRWEVCTFSKNYKYIYGFKCFFLNREYLSLI